MEAFGRGCRWSQQDGGEARQTPVVLMITSVDRLQKYWGGELPGLAADGKPLISVCPASY